MKLEFSRHIFEKYSNIKFHENPSSGNGVVACGRTDMEKVIVAFRNFAKVLTNSYKSIRYQKYNFYLVIEVPDHVYVFYAYRLYFADKDIYMIRYFYHKIEIIRVFYYYE